MAVHSKSLLSAAAAVVTGAVVSGFAIIGLGANSQQAPRGSSQSYTRPHLLAAASPACHITQRQSQAGGNATTIKFVNHHSGTVGVYWLSYQGNLVYYKTLTRHASFNQVTFRKNAWVVLSSSFNCVGFVVTVGQHQFVIK